MAARNVIKVSPGDDAKDLEADDTKAEAAPLGPMPHAPTLHHLATREPHSFHQTTIYYGLVRQDTPPRRKYGLLAASIGIVCLQCLVATGLSLGVTLSTCSENSDCGLGTFATRGFVIGAFVRLRIAAKPTQRKPAPLGEKKSKNPCAPIA